MHLAFSLLTLTLALTLLMPRTPLLQTIFGKYRGRILVTYLVTLAENLFGTHLSDKPNERKSSAATISGLFSGLEIRLQVHSLSLIPPSVPTSLANPVKGTVVQIPARSRKVSAGEGM